MYNCLYKFLEANNLIYSLQFGFRQKHSTSHALIHLSDKIREQLDKGHFACGNFVDFQKAFDTVDHHILIQKLNYCGFDSDVNTISRGVPQGSILGPLLFLIYINDLHFAMKNCNVHHFADDTNLLNFKNSIKKINKQVGHELKYLSYWLHARKI